MSPARAQTRSARSGVKRANHEATAPPLYKTYRIENIKISSEVYNLYGNAKVSFAGSLRNVNQILVVSSLLHSRTVCLSVYIIIANCRKFSLIWYVQYAIEISQFPQSFFFLFCNVGSIPLDPSLTQSLEDSQAFIDLFPDSPTLNAVKMITSKLVQMESNGDQCSKEQVLSWKINNGCWACGIYTAGQVWLRWPSDQPLDSPYSASLLWIKPVRMRITTIINWKILSWCTNQSSEHWCAEKWRTVKENWKWWRYEVCSSIYTHL